MIGPLRDRIVARIDFVMRLMKLHIPTIPIEDAIVHRGQRREHGRARQRFSGVRARFQPNDVRAEQRFLERRDTHSKILNARDCANERNKRFDPKVGDRKMLIRDRAGIFCRGGRWTARE